MKPVTPQAWAEALSGPPVLTSDGPGWRAGLMRRWRGTDAEMHQPLLDHHYLVLHLGGPKRVRRAGRGEVVVTDVAEGAVTIVPAGTRYSWRTDGPIDFAHLYIHPARFTHALDALRSAEGGALTLADRVGVQDPLLTRLLGAMLEELQGRGGSTCAYLDVLFDAVLAQLAWRHAAPGAASAPVRYTLAPQRLRQVLDHVERRLGEALDLAELAEVAGLSRYHFARAFHRTMGEPPLAYVARRRLNAAKELLRATDLPLAAVARSAGYASPSHFSAAFKRRTGLQPSQFRRLL